MTLIVALLHVTIGAAMILRGDRAHEGDPAYAAESGWWTRAGFMVGWSAMLVLALLAAMVGGGDNRPGPPAAGGGAA